MAIKLEVNGHAARGRRRSRHPAAVGAARHARPDRHQVRLRHRPVRRLHRARRRQAVRSCVAPVGATTAAEITTIEGVSGKAAQAVQTAWQQLDVVQCGYCQSGQIMTTVALLAEIDKPTRRRHRRRARRQHLPLRHLSPHPRRRARGGPPAGGLSHAGDQACSACRRAEPPAVPDRRGRRRRRPDARLPRAARARRPRAGGGADAINPINAYLRIAPRQHGHRAVGPHGRRPGHLYRHRHAGRRGARRRLGADAGRGRRRQPEALRQHGLGRRGPGHRRLDRHDQLLGALPARGRDGARHAGRRRRPRAGACRPREIRVDEGRAQPPPRGPRPASASSPMRRRRVPPPAEVRLKDPSAWVYIGNEKLRRLDSVAKTTGAQQFPIDVRLPGMLTAVLARPPLFGAKARSFDASAAKAGHRASSTSSRRRAGSPSSPRTPGRR